MQSAATVLDVLRKRGEKGLPLERLYRQLFNPQLFLLAYGRIYANTGAMTPGVTDETVDGMSLAKSGAIIDALRAERYRWRPVKRVYIPKAGGRLRPLGLPTWSDKLVAEVVRLLLEAYYEPQFSDRSHGFRPGRGCHTALSEVVDVWKGTHWFIEGDISDCFGSLDHQVMLSILAERIHDGRFLRLLGQRRRALPSQDPGDPGYRRLRYVRYADDWLLGFAGPKHEAEQITSRIAAFLREELKLELSESKTLITHATSQAARFLGYEIKAQHADAKITRGRRAVNGAIGLFVPRDVVRQRCTLYLRKGSPAQRGSLLHDDDFTIVAKYQAEYAGLVQYYLLAQDVFRLGALHWIMETSLLKTLAGKHRSTVTRMARRYKATIQTSDGPRACLQVIVERDGGRKPLIARFGGIPLRRQRTAVLTDQRPVMAINLRLEDGRLCCLVIVGVRADGRKELVAVADGERESGDAWAELLRDLRRRGMRAPVVMVGDGALGLWAALREVFPATREQRCWVHRACADSSWWLAGGRCGVVGGDQGEHLRPATKPHGRGWELEAVFLQQGEHVVDRVADGATAHVKQVGQCPLGADLQ